MDQLHSMSVFVAVAEEGGFAPAAKRLNMSPPSVTRAVSALEALLGARLFHRTTRSVQLSEPGERYLTDCRRILAEIEAADRHAAGLHAAPTGSVTVTGPVLFGRMVVAPAIFDLMEHYPKISVSTIFVDRVVHLIDEGIDVAVRIAELPDSSLSAMRVGEVRRVLCASPDYLGAHGEPKVPHDLTQHSTIEHTATIVGGEWSFMRQGKREFLHPRSRLQANSADVAIAAAVASRGITRVLSYQVAKQLQTGELVLVLDEYGPPPVPVHVVHKETGHTSARVRAVFDFLVKRIRSEFARFTVPH